MHTGSLLEQVVVETHQSYRDDISEMGVWVKRNLWKAEEDDMSTSGITGRKYTRLRMEAAVQVHNISSSFQQNK